MFFTSCHKWTKTVISQEWGGEIKKQHGEKLGIIIGNVLSWKVKLVPSLNIPPFFEAYFIGMMAYGFFP